MWRNKPAKILGSKGKWEDMWEEEEREWHLWRKLSGEEVKEKGEKIGKTEARKLPKRKGRDNKTEAANKAM